MRLAIDPGHGGKDRGAVGRSGLQEKEVTLAVGLALAATLARQGQDVFVTRNTDVYVPLWQRIALVETREADLLVSLHVNGSVSPALSWVSGHVLHLGGTAESVARVLLNNLATVTGWPNAGVFATNFYLLQGSKMPAFILEMGFISNPEQEKWLARPDNQRTLAEALARGLGQVNPDIQQVTFPDIAGHWARDAIEEAYRLGFLSGFPDGTFKPQEAVTRAELAAALFKLLKKNTSYGVESAGGD